MQQSAEPLAQAIFIRTDLPEYGEEVIRARDLQELMDVCSQNHSHCTLDRVLIRSRGEPHGQELVLKFVSVTKAKQSV